MKRAVLTGLSALAMMAGAGMASDLLYQSGDLVNRPGGGFEGADRSAPAPDQSLGFNIRNEPVVEEFNRAADDFEVTDPDGWEIGRVRIYAYSTDWDYQDGSPIESVSIRIYDDNPMTNPNAEIVYGDLETNRLIDSQFADLFRTSGSFEDTRRAIFWVDAFMDVTLPPGEYWLEWGVERISAAGSGPWGPGIETSYQTYGNAIQRTSSGWQEREEDYPFFIYDKSDNELFDNNFDDFVFCTECHLDVPSAGLALNGPGAPLGINIRNAIQDPAGQTMFRAADLFDVTDGEWQVDRIRVFAYSTGWDDLENSPFEGVSFQLWDDDPRQGGESIFGDPTTDRLSEAAWTGAYRASDSNPDSDSRAIFYFDFEVDLQLQEGTYAVDYSVVEFAENATSSWTPGLAESYDPAGGTAFLWRSSTGTFDATNRPESVAIEVYGDAEACIADWNGDGEVDINDFFAYLGDFEAGNPRADLNNDGEIDINDFFIYLQEFEAGC